MTDTNKPVFNACNVIVKDMEASLAFYGRLGLEVEDMEGPWKAHHCRAVTPSGLELEFDSVESAKVWNAGWRSDGTARSVVIGFLMPSRDAVDELYTQMTGTGYGGQQPPYDAFWGARYAIVEDPDGNPVGFMSPIDPARASAPPDPT